MMSTSDAVWIAAITAFSGLGVAITNMIGSVCMLYIRAKYKYTEQSNGGISHNGVRDVPNTGPKP